VLAMLGQVDWNQHEVERGLERLGRAYGVLRDAEPDEGFAAVAAEYARFLFFTNDLDRAQETVDAALEVAERLWIPETLSQSLNTAGLIVARRGRWEQGFALITRALEIALENDRTAAALRAYNNIGDMLDRRDRYEEAVETDAAGLALARRVGTRGHEWRLLGELAFMLLWLGRVDEARATIEQVPPEGLEYGAAYALPIYLALLDGNLAEARRLADASTIGRSEAEPIQDRVGYLLLEATLSNAEGNHEAALEFLRPCLDLPVDSTTKLVYEEALIAADGLGRDDETRAILARIDVMPQGVQSPTMRGHSLRFRARLGEEPDDRFRSAAALFREYGVALKAAVVQLDHAAWLRREGRTEEADALLAEARAVFEERGVRPWLVQLDLVPEPVATMASEAQ